MSDSIHRAVVLLSQQRYDLAERELRGALAEDPDNALAHAWLAQALIGQGKSISEAVGEARTAVHLAPDIAATHFVLSLALEKQGKLRDAEAAAQEAIRLEPADADFHARLAAIYIDACRWQEALDVAQRGLEADPTHVLCVNLRAIALRNLGRPDAAGIVLESALALDPESALTHANRGWQELERGNPTEAATHFREALRLDPELEWARAGILEALRARNLPYRLMLRYFLWMSKLPPNVRWAVVVGGFVMAKVLDAIGQENPSLLPIIMPLRFLYGVFVYFTWTAKPLVNLLLRLDPLGRAVLTPQQLRMTNAVAACVGITVLALAEALIFQEPIGLITALLSALMLIPVSGLFSARDERIRQGVGIYCTVMAAVAVFVTVTLALDIEALWGPALMIFVYMLAAYVWLGNLILSREKRD